MKSTVSAIALIVATFGASSAAWATCEVKHGTVANVLANHPTGSHLETDCASTSAQAITDAAQDGIIVTKADTSYVDSENAGQDAVIATKADTTYVDAQNGAQDTVIATKASTTYVNSQNAAQDAVIATKVDKTRLDSFGPSNAAPVGSLENWAGGVNSTLGTHNDQIIALQGLTASHGATLNAHSALLSEHSARLDEHAKGLAIAMSLPDLYLTERERFSIAGNLGGFGDETGIGAGVAIRLDQNWSINGKLGADIEFKEFGWSVGARAGF